MVPKESLTYIMSESYICLSRKKPSKKKKEAFNIEDFVQPQKFKDGSLIKSNVVQQNGPQTYLGLLWAECVCSPLNSYVVILILKDYSISRCGL